MKAKKKSKLDFLVTSVRADVAAATRLGLVAEEVKGQGFGALVYIRQT